MNDSTQAKARQLAREFKIGITLLAVLFCVFIGVAFRRYRMSFSDPPSKSIAQATQPVSASPPPLDDASSNAGSPMTPELLGERTPYEPPQYEDANSSAVHIPPPSEFSSRTAANDMSSGGETSGGSFQPSGHSLEADGSANYAPPSFPAGGSFAPPPSESSRATPSALSPATIELAPPNSNEPATFQVPPTEVETVQRTQFEKSEIENKTEDSGTQSGPPPPLSFAIEGTSKPIDQATRVEPIRTGDSFWLISQRAYGNGGYFRALYEHNRERFPEPDELPAGASVEIPSPDYLRQRFPEFCPKEGGNESSTAQQEPGDSKTERVYVVVGGESLFDVARYQLGQGSRYVEILQLNRDVLKGNLEALTAGLKLRLPQR
jgi:nucleoid-associated protein YgaU